MAARGPWAAVRDACLSSLSEVLSITLSSKLLTSSGRQQLSVGLRELLLQQQAACAPPALRLDKEAVTAFCCWLEDPAIGVGGVLRPPPHECPLERIVPREDSEHVRQV